MTRHPDITQAFNYVEFSRETREAARLELRLATSEFANRVAALKEQGEPLFPEVLKRGDVRIPEDAPQPPRNYILRLALHPPNTTAGHIQEITEGMINTNNWKSLSIETGALKALTSVALAMPEGDLAELVYGNADTGKEMSEQESLNRDEALDACIEWLIQVRRWLSTEYDRGAYVAAYGHCDDLAGSLVIIRDESMAYLVTKESTKKSMTMVAQPIRIEGRPHQLVLGDEEHDRRRAVLKNTGQVEVIWSPAITAKQMKSAAVVATYILRLQEEYSNSDTYQEALKIDWADADRIAYDIHQWERDRGSELDGDGYRSQMFFPHDEDLDQRVGFTRRAGKMQDAALELAWGWLPEQDKAVTYQWHCKTSWVSRVTPEQEENYDRRNDLFDMNLLNEVLDVNSSDFKYAMMNPSIFAYYRMLQLLVQFWGNQPQVRAVATPYNGIIDWIALHEMLCDADLVDTPPTL